MCKRIFWRIEMVFKLKTSQRTMDIYRQIENREHLQPYILVKLSMALAIKDGYHYTGELTDTAGLELNRQTITNEYDVLFKSLIQINEGKHIPEEDYFPAYMKAYIDHGATDIYTHLMNLEMSI